MNYYFLFFSFILLLAISPTYAQILNAGFENWTNGVPDDWLTNDASGVNPITYSTSRHSGSFAVKGTILTQGFSEAVPALLAGADGNGFPISARPEALHGFYMFVPYSFAYPDTLFIAIEVSKQDTVIGVDTLFIGDPTVSYQEFVANIHYTSSGTPDLVNISATIGRFNYGNRGTLFLLDDLSFGPAVGVDEPRTTIPSTFQLSQNYPNPFNPTTDFGFRIADLGFVSLKVYDVLGRDVVTLVNEVKQPGEYTVRWNADGVPSGVYFYRLQAGRFTDIKKMVLLK